jgi:hypothetical protein
MLRPLALATAAFALAAPAAARAADIQVDRACYLEDKRSRVALSGAGFTPGETYKVTLDGTPLPGGVGRVDSTGAIAGTFAAPALEEGVPEHRFVLGVTEGPKTVATTFSVTSFFADFRPSTGNPRSLKVRFSAYGLGLVQKDPLAPVTQTLYVHYVPPAGGGRAQTYRLGTLQGPCGRIKRTRRRRLFPFAPRQGQWNLQFDTNAVYRRGTSSAAFQYFSVGVKVRARG